MKRDNYDYRKLACATLLVAVVVPFSLVLLERLTKTPPDQHWLESVMIAPHQRNLPDFAVLADAEERKQAFVGYMLPLLHHANNEIRKEKRHLKQLLEQYASGIPLEEEDQQWMLEIANKYEVEDFHFSEEMPEEEQLKVWDLLFDRVDTIPISMALAQAATETGWGTSRFARDGYNMFGHWCYYQGCGLEPMERNEGETHEVRIFDTVYESVQAYIHNLNSNAVYGQLRELRSLARQEGQMVAGLDLAGGLERYSQLGEEYIKIIRSVIRQNGLEHYDMQTYVEYNPPAKEKDYSTLSLSVRSAG